MATTTDDLGTARAQPTATPGRTTVADSVVAKLAGLAAQDVAGVHALGSDAARAFGSIRGAFGSSTLGQGVRVEVGETRASVAVALVVDYPVPMQEVASAVRAAVAESVTDLVGLEVTAVDVAIVGVAIPEETGAR